MEKTNIRTIIGLMLILFIATVPIVCAQSDSTTKAIDIDLNKEGGVLIIPTTEDSIVDLSTTKVSEKTASAALSGIIDENNQVRLEGTITLDGKEKKVKLYGEATQVFVGWDVPEGAKPIYTKIGNTTMTRYEGATKKYATYVDVSDKSGKYTLHGEFYDDGSGGFVGYVDIDGKECQIGLRGTSMSIYENTIPSVEAKTNVVLSVPQRSQWEIYWDGHGYTAASNACGETVAAMLEEYYTSSAPDIWDIWVYNGYDSMSASEAQDYLDDQGVYLQKGTRSGTVAYTIGKIKDMVDDGRPFYLTEESSWGNCHAVVLKGYYDVGIYSTFRLNDPNTLSGDDSMKWYRSQDMNFNYEDNVYQYVCSSDTTSTGYSFLG